MTFKLIYFKYVYYKFIILIGDSEKISLIDWFTVFNSLFYSRSKLFTIGRTSNNFLLCTIGEFVLLIFLCFRTRYKNSDPTG